MSSLKPVRVPGGWGEAAAVWSALAAIALAVALTWVPLHVQAVLTGGRRPAVNPAELLGQLGRGDVEWTTTTTMLAAATLLLLLALVGLIVWFWRRVIGSGGARVDRAASRLGRGRDTTALAATSARATARRLGVPDRASAGLPVGRSVVGKRPLVQDWEAVSVDVWGPRAGKTSARAIPAILDAPGSVIATSNKRDLVDATRHPRSALGEVWVFDPQELVGEEPTWWWNPLTYVVDESAARELAGVFASAGRPVNARTDAYFDAAAIDLISGLLLAAASGGRPLTQVYEWLTDPNDDEPAQLLAGAGHRLTAAAVRGVVNAPDKQRAGVYGTAAQICSFMTNTTAMRWVTPPSRAARQFSPSSFAHGAQTLYCVSREGHGNAGALVTAMTAAVCEAVEKQARCRPNGRLEVPMVAVLDEAANVCRWGELPNLYSHYGSRGIVLMTFLQSWSQGVEAWGRDGMRKLWSAATVKVYGGGVSEVEFLEEVSQLLGQYQRLDTTTTRGRQGRSTSRHHRMERILDVSDLASFERGRALVFAASHFPP